jgi:hypothetical protein
VKERGILFSAPGEVPTMRERGILFSGAMVRALLSGTKTQTRRVVAPQPHRVAEHIKPIGKLIPSGEPIKCRIPDGWAWRDLYASDEFKDDPGHFATLMRPYCPYGVNQDRLWVRETWRQTEDIDGTAVMEYRCGGTRLVVDGPAIATGEHRVTSVLPPWRPSIFMPRWASRITLEVTEVRVQRLQDISEEDARAEGITGPHDVGYPAYRVPDDSKPRYSCAVAAYEALWDSINGDRAPWASSPWVWAVSFRRVQP